MFIPGSSAFDYKSAMRGRAILAILLTLVAFSAPAEAQWRRAPMYGRGVQPLEGILPGIRRAHPGRFYDAEGPYPDAGGGMHYRIKWLTPDGRVIWLDTDARTGRVIGPAGAPSEGPGGFRPAEPPAGRFVPPPGGPGMGHGFPPGWGRPGFGGWRPGAGRWPHGH